MTAQGTLQPDAPPLELVLDELVAVKGAYLRDARKLADAEELKNEVNFVSALIRVYPYAFLERMKF